MKEFSFEYNWRDMFIFKIGNFKTGTFLLVEEAERIFKRFGSILTAVENSAYLPKKNFDFLKWVVLYCRDGYLKRLTVCNLKISDVQSIELQPIFKQLKRLMLFRVVLTDDPAIFTGMNYLVELELFDVENCKAIIDNRFPKLERFDHGSCELPMNTFSPFILRHNSTLKALKFNVETGYTTEFWETILGSCKKLEALEIVGGNMKPIVFEDLKLFSSMAALRELSLHWCVLPIDHTQFASFAHLIKLRLQLLGRRDVPAIVSHLVKLEELEIYEDDEVVVMDEKMFSEIVEIVKRRPQMLILECGSDFDATNYKENQTVRLIPRFFRQ